MACRERLVVLGILGRTPIAGVSWQVLQYLEGFRRLGYDLYYVEDTGDWPYHPEYPVAEQRTPPPGRNQYAINSDYAVAYVAELMASHGFQDRWCYCSRLDGRTFGMTRSQLSEVLDSAVVLINLTGSTRLSELPEVYRRVPVRVYLETDPVIRQIQLANGDAAAIELMEEHTHHFTYGENIGGADSGVPTTAYKFRPTRQPIITDWWKSCGDTLAAVTGDGSMYTTIGTWAQADNDVEWRGERYHWSKHFEFLKFIDLPRRVPRQFELALLCKTPEDSAAVPLLLSHGWRVRDGLSISKQIRPYRDYIKSSRAEFTVAKDQNIRLRSGWFSDRSACYLAAGKPVITQDTAFGKVLPTGRGLFAFTTMAEVLSAIEAIETDYSEQCLAARDLACDCFAAEKVLTRLMQDLDQ
jgi:hypothetical protein